MTVLGTRALNRATLARQFLLDRADAAGPRRRRAPRRAAGAGTAGTVRRALVAAARVRPGGALGPADSSGGSCAPTSCAAPSTSSPPTTPWPGGPATTRCCASGCSGSTARELAGVDLDELAAAGRAVLADDEPRSMPELGRVLAERWPDVPPRALGETVIALVPLVQLPPRGLWRQAGPARNVPLASWLGRERRPAVPGRRRPGRRGAGTALPRRVRPGRHGRPARLVRPRRPAGRGGRVRERAGHLPRRARPRAARPPRRAAPRPRHARPGAVPARRSTTRSSATTTAAGSSTTPTAACRWPATRVRPGRRPGRRDLDASRRRRAASPRCAASPAPTATTSPRRAGRWPRSSPTTTSHRVTIAASPR